MQTKQTNKNPTWQQQQKTHTHTHTQNTPWPTTKETKNPENKTMKNIYPLRFSTAIHKEKASQNYTVLRLYFQTSDIHILQT